MDNTISNQPLFTTSSKLTAHAIFMGQRLDTGRFMNYERLASNPLMIRAEEQGVVALFRYGVLVFFGMDNEAITRFLDKSAPLVTEPFSTPESDRALLITSDEDNDRVINNQIVLKDFNARRLQVVADVLAKNVILGHYETGIAGHFDHIEPLARGLTMGHKIRSSRAMLKHIGEMLLIEAKMIGRVEVSEKPELIWEYPEHERLYLRLEDEFELSERHQAITHKFGLIARTAETTLSILQDQRTLRVEWYIVILIVIDIAITLTEKALGI